MPQVTKLVGLYVPKIQCETVLDIGIGDGETIGSIAPMFGVKKIYGVEPSGRSLGRIKIEAEVDNVIYEKSKYFQESFDLITLFDSLACWNIELLSNKLVLIWTPECYYPYNETDVEGAHAYFQSGWHASELLDRGYSVFKAINIHQGPPIAANGILAWKLKNNWR